VKAHSLSLEINESLKKILFPFSTDRLGHNPGMPYIDSHLLKNVPISNSEKILFQVEIDSESFDQAMRTPDMTTHVRTLVRSCYGHTFYLNVMVCNIPNLIEKVDKELANLILKKKRKVHFDCEKGKREKGKVSA
jgi:hypothetical protein